MSQGWKYLLANSSDLSVLAELLTADDRTLSVDLNKSGSAGCTIPMRDRASHLVVPWQTCLVVMLDDVVVWSGPITVPRRTYSSGRMSISAVSWFDRLNNFLVPNYPSVTYTATDAGAIASALIGMARTQDPTLPITVGSVLPTQLRTVTYSRDQNIGSAISDLVALESGFDWYINPVTRAFNIVGTLGSTLPNVKWTFLQDRDQAQSNLADVEDAFDGTTVVNWIAPRGKYGTITPVQDASSQASYGVFMSAPSLSDVVDPTILAAYGNAEIVYLAQPRTTYTLTPKTNANKTVPRLFKDFNIGDTTYLTARRDGHSIGPDQAIRIFGASVSISKSGVATLSNLQTTASG